MSTRAEKSPFDLKRLEADRRSLGWTYSRLAESTGLSVRTTIHFMRGRNHSPKTAKLIAFALGQPLARYVKDAEVSA